MKFIKLTSHSDKSPIYINFDLIVDFYQNTNDRIGTFTIIIFNTSDFISICVNESPEEILELIKEVESER
jgi:hypothetical protein